MKESKNLTLEERLMAITLEENQGGDLQKMDYIYYLLLGAFFPGFLLIWGWY